MSQALYQDKTLQVTLSKSDLEKLVLDEQVFLPVYIRGVVKSVGTVYLAIDGPARMALYQAYDRDLEIYDRRHIRPPDNRSVTRSKTPKKR